ncbi:MAG: 4a-hydroxytetrahydrobiopterin dehydratase [Tahibacter sp.]
MNHAELVATTCVPRKGPGDAVTDGDANTLLKQLPEWKLGDDGKDLRREFKFPDFHHTIGFVNAVAWMANREDHHPDLEVGYNYCRMRWSTHDVGGLSLNDFICAAKVDALFGKD